MAHPFAGSWGYQVTGYFAPNPAHGEPDDLRFLIDTAHRAGLGVILDWVPAHFPRDIFALARFDGSALYEHADPRQRLPPGLGHSLIFNYGRQRRSVSFLISSALYWLEEFHVDGLRVDAVASMLYLDYSRDEGEWVPNQVWRAREPRGDRVPPQAQHRGRTMQRSPRTWSPIGRGVDRLARCVSRPGLHTAASGSG